MKKLLALFFTFFIFSSEICIAENVVGFLIPNSGLGDQSFNDMTYAGLIQAKKSYNFSLIREQCADFTPQSRQAAMEMLISRGANIIVTNGWEFQEIVRRFATNHPDLIFIINDIPLADLPNVISTVFGQHEGSFLAGALAGWMTETGKIGFIGGKDMPVIRAFQTGYREGAVYARPDIELTEIFLSLPEDTFSGFDDPALAYKKAKALYKQDIDIIFSVAGLSGNGIIRAAADSSKYAIGVDADQDHMAKGNVLTSVMKRLDKATVEALRIALTGKIVTGAYYLGLKEGGVALSPMNYTRQRIPKGILEKLEELKIHIIKGDIVVTDYLTKN